jgi:hypothetical protein
MARDVLARGRSRRLVERAVLLATTALLGIVPCFAAVGTSSGAAAEELSVAGFSPSAIALSWTEDSSLGFAGYEVYRATTVAGPWTGVGSVASASETSYYVDGLTPSTTYYWKVVDARVLGTVNSNVASAPQPATATLTLGSGGDTSVKIGWSNHAVYGGGVTFGSYEIDESLGNGSFMPAESFDSATVENATVTGLSASTAYRFEVRTTDVCRGASNCPEVPSASVTTSNVLAFRTPTELMAAANVSAHLVVAGTPVQFSCGASGGSPPYVYTWNFSDGAVHQGSSVTRSFARSGTLVATCTVTDSASADASNLTAVNILASHAGSNSSSGGDPGRSRNNTSSGSNGFGGAPPTGGSLGQQPLAPAGLGPIAATILLLGFLGAVVWLATLVGRKGPGPGRTPSPQGGSGASPTAAPVDPLRDPVPAPIESAGAPKPPEAPGAPSRSRTWLP